MALEVHGQHGVPFGLAHVRERPVTEDAGVVYQDVEATERELGPVNILVNNAGAYSEKMALDFPEPDFEWQQY